jgi:nitrous oxidase accessory protein NosD
VSRSTRTWSGEGGYGIVLGTGSERNSFTSNTIRNNSAAGFAIDIFGLGYPSPNHNRIFHNAFYGNDVQAYDKGDSNVWEDGYPSGGNFWSDYEGFDANRDGLGDTAYPIGSNNSDRYPLMTFH